MGVTTLTLQVANPAAPEVTESLEFTVDSGATFSVVSADVLQRLGIQPLQQETFELANNARIVRRTGVALFKFREYQGGAPVIFGEPDDATLLGALSLEALGLGLDPIKRELHRIRLTL